MSNIIPETMKTSIYNIVILDESGSMSCIKQQAINGYNETVQTIKEAQKKHGETQQHYITLITFDTSEIKTIYDRIPCEQASELNSENYRPNAGTPLYDAMGMTCSKLRYMLDEKADNRVLVTIITDGEENSSVEYNSDMIRKLVEELKSKNWIFTYIGANQDVEEVAAAISITNTLSFDSVPEETSVMFQKESRSRSRFFDRIANNECNETLQEDYFKE